MTEYTLIGIYIFQSGEIYSGSWSNNVRSGLGVTLDQESVHVGIYKDDQLGNKALALYADGSYFEGEFINGSREGNGVYIWSNGDWYQGKWHAGNAMQIGTMGWGNKPNRKGQF